MISTAMARRMYFALAAVGGTSHTAELAPGNRSILPNLVSPNCPLLTSTAMARPTCFALAGASGTSHMAELAAGNRLTPHSSLLQVCGSGISTGMARRMYFALVAVDGTSHPAELAPGNRSILPNLAFRAWLLVTSMATVRRTCFEPLAGSGTCHMAELVPGKRSILPFGTTPNLRFADFDGDGKTDVFAVGREVHIGLRVSRFTTAGIDNARADEIFADATNILRSDDSPSDRACLVHFERVGDVTVFANGDGSIDTQAEYDAVIALPGNVKIVNQINFCVVSKPGFLGSRQFRVTPKQWSVPLPVWKGFSGPTNMATPGDCST